MSSLQDVLTGPQSKVSYLDADIRTYPCKVLPVNVSSAKETVAGFLPSTSPTDAQNINTGSWHDFSSPGISWALVAALWCLVARTTTALMSMGKGQGTVSFTFPTTAVRQKELS